ncbi:glucose-6-phosphate isomerase [Microbacter margulisiae]|uniref:Glucose-6-phosphate isomerase n=1 Tax=Microbacter margulisiae TaxID=1350067 RepID=A0A7W5DP38_9PORP|nr:glucose-6-phosphate isomerase [Microbacter margulisiae]MBB3186397.1 glucose-6-phosphate isomerase [Microbacter margulisiae]
MKTIKLNIDKTSNFVSKDVLDSYEKRANDANSLLHEGIGLGNDFLGWLHLPSSISEAEIEELEATAKTLRDNCEVVVVIGIGGSYLGAKAVIDALSCSFDAMQATRKNPLIVYAGHNICEDYLFELQSFLKNKKFGIISISKSGTTTEPALAFRLLREQLEAQQGKASAQQLIVAVTDKARGALRTLATQEGYKTFVIEDSVGGRYSVLTPVGLLPIAVAGFSIRDLIAGAMHFENLCGPEIPFDQNPAALYAAVRNALYQSGKKTEILVNFHPKLHYFNEWWKQLYGESEGKENKGIFPAAVDFTTDLHSMGQWIQQGERTIFETVVSVQQSNHEVRVPSDEANLDGLNYLAGKRVDEVNKMAELGTMIAHVDGGVPNLKLELPELKELYLGQMIYFFEKACGISGYILGINPFDQPGVEDYKKNMFALLEKPGYEEATKAIKAKL